MSEAREHRLGRAGLLLVVGLLAAAIGVWWFVSHQQSAPLPESVRVEVDEQGLGPGGAADGDRDVGRSQQQSSERDAVDAREPGIYVHVLDSSGEPMPGFRVELVSPASMSGESLNADEQGWCAFLAKSAARYELSTQPIESVRKEIAYSGSGVFEVEFRMPKGMVAVLGRCTRSGRVKTNRSLIRWRDGKWRLAGYAPDGFYRLVLPEGASRLGLVGALGLETPCYTWTQPIPRGVARHEWAVDVPCSDLLVEVSGPGPEVGAGGKVELLFDPNGAALTRTSELTDKGFARFSWLPPGEYEVRAVGPGFVAPAVRHVTVQQVHRLESVRIAVQAATTVTLRLDTGDRMLLLAKDRGLPTLIASADPERVLRGQLPLRRSGSREGEIRFTGVPPGRVELRSADGVVDEQWHYLAFEPIEPVFAEARLGEQCRLSVQAVPRAFVDLRACEMNGRECFRATIEVYAGDRRVCSYSVRGCQRFCSHMPPGDYRIVIDRGGVLQERLVTVGRKDLRLRLRP